MTSSLFDPEMDGFHENAWFSTDDLVGLEVCLVVAAHIPDGAALMVQFVFLLEAGFLIGLKPLLKRLDRRTSGKRCGPS